MLRLLLILIFSCAMTLSSFAAKTKGKPTSKAQTKSVSKTVSKKAPVTASKKTTTKTTKTVAKKVPVSKGAPTKKTVSSVRGYSKSPTKNMSASKSKYSKQPSRAPAAAKPTFTSMEKSQKDDSPREEVSSRAMNYRSPSALGDGKTLQITGQNRNLNMSLILGGKSDKVEFGEVREDYRREVIGTQY